MWFHYGSAFIADRIILTKRFKFTVTVVEENTCMNHKLSSINIIKNLIAVKLKLFLFSYICNLLLYCQLINMKFVHHLTQLPSSNIFMNMFFFRWKFHDTSYKHQLFCSSKKYIFVVRTTCTLRVHHFWFFFLWRRLSDLRNLDIMFCSCDTWLYADFVD